MADLPDPQLVLYIRRVNPGITAQFIASVFMHKDIGDVSFVDLQLVHGKNYWQATIYFKQWFVSDQTIRMQKMLLNNIATYVQYQGANKAWRLKALPSFTTEQTFKQRLWLLTQEQQRHYQQWQNLQQAEHELRTFCQTHGLTWSPLSSAQTELDLQWEQATAETAVTCANQLLVDAMQKIDEALQQPIKDHQAQHTQDHQADVTSDDEYLRYNLPVPQEAYNWLATAYYTPMALYAPYYRPHCQGCVDMYHGLGGENQEAHTCYQ